MRQIEVIANSVTTFGRAGAFDEGAYRAHLERMVEAGVGIFAGSPGSGEIHTLSEAEFKRTCEIAVEIGHGRVPVFSMTTEAHDIDELLRYAHIGADAGVDEVQFFQYMGGHGMKPTTEDQRAYWNAVLSAIDHPVAMSLHAIAGYLGEAALVGELCKQYDHVKTVYMYGGTIYQMLALRDALPGHVRLGGHLGRAIPEMAIGVGVLTGAEPNVIPRTSRALVDAYLAGDIAKLEELNERYTRLMHASERWGPPNFRWLKMALTVLDLPGANSELRAPMVNPTKADLDAMAKVFATLGVASWEAV